MYLWLWVGVKLGIIPAGLFNAIKTFVEAI
jgi:hypothetical protein